MKVAPFMPPIFGSEQMANFQVFNYPGAGTYCLGGFAALLLLAIYLSWRRARLAMAL